MPEAVSWNLAQSLPELLAIARRATQEHYAEMSLEGLKDTWSRLELFSLGIKKHFCILLN